MKVSKSLEWLKPCTVFSEGILDIIKLSISLLLSHLPSLHLESITSNTTGIKRLLLMTMRIKMEIQGPNLFFNLTHKQWNHVHALRHWTVAAPGGSLRRGTNEVRSINAQLTAWRQFPGCIEGKETPVEPGEETESGKPTSKEVEGLRIHRTEHERAAQGGPWICRAFPLPPPQLFNEYKPSEVCEGSMNHQKEPEETIPGAQKGLESLWYTRSECKTSQSSRCQMGYPKCTALVLEKHCSETLRKPEMIKLFLSTF